MNPVSVSAIRKRIGVSASINLTICATVIISRLADARSSISEPKLIATGRTRPSRSLMVVEVRPPIRRIVRLRLESYQPPRRVMQLRRVQPHMNMRESRGRGSAGSRASPAIASRRSSSGAACSAASINATIGAVSTSAFVTSRHHRAAECRRLRRIALRRRHQFDLIGDSRARQSRASQRAAPMP